MSAAHFLVGCHHRSRLAVAFSATRQRLDPLPARGWIKPDRLLPFFLLLLAPRDRSRKRARGCSGSRGCKEGSLLLIWRRLSRRSRNAGLPAQDLNNFDVKACCQFGVGAITSLIERLKPALAALDNQSGLQTSLVVGPLHEAPLHLPLLVRGVE